jgi:hypothetical protein
VSFVHALPLVLLALASVYSASLSLELTYFLLSISKLSELLALVLVDTNTGQRRVLNKHAIARRFMRAHLNQTVSVELISFATSIVEVGLDVT